MSMGKSYSVDLRLRVVGAVDSGMSKMAAHKLFKVSRSTIDDWLKLRLETGDVIGKAPQERRQPRALSGTAFSEFAATQQGATLGQMAAAWQRQHGQKLSVMSFSRALAGLGDKGWTRKKRVGATVNAMRPSARRSGSS
jgi:transposase